MKWLDYLPAAERVLLYIMVIALTLMCWNISSQLVSIGEEFVIVTKMQARLFDSMDELKNRQEANTELLKAIAAKQGSLGAKDGR